MIKYNLKVIQSRNRLEVYRYSVPQVKGKGNNHNGRKGKSDCSKKVEKNRKEVLNKARNNIIRLVNCNPELCTFITFTYASNMQDLKQSKEDLRQCIRYMQKFWKGLKYLYVLEYQRRGAIHYHMLCNIPMTIKTARNGEYKSTEQKELEQYFHEVYWPYGWVDIRNLKEQGVTNVGLYVSVYLVEDLLSLNLEGARCYGYSRNLDKPTVSVISQECTMEDIIKEYQDWYNIQYISSYNISFKVGSKTRKSVVNYFDMYEK